MKRPVGVILTAILQFLGSLAVLAMSASTVFLIARLPTTPGVAPPPTLPAGMSLGIAAFYGLFAVLGFLTAIGLFRMRSWARYSTLIFAGFVVVVSLILALVFVLMEMPENIRSPAEIAAIRGVLTAFSLGFAALGAVCLYYFNRRSTKAAFLREGADSDVNATGIEVRGRRVPLSIAVIAGTQLLGGLGGLVFAAWIPATVFLGLVLTGISAKLFTLGTSAIGIYIGVALLRLSNTGRLVAIAMHCVWIGNALIIASLPNRFLEYMAYVAKSMGQPSSASQQFPVSGMRFISAGSMVVGFLALYFLVTRAYAFREETPKEVAVV